MEYRERERGKREREERARLGREGTRQQRRERRRGRWVIKIERAFSHSILHHPILPIVIRWKF